MSTPSEDSPICRGPGGRRPHVFLKDIAWLQRSCINQFNGLARCRSAPLALAEANFPEARGARKALGAAPGRREDDGLHKASSLRDTSSQQKQKEGGQGQKSGEGAKPRLRSPDAPCAGKSPPARRCRRPPPPRRCAPAAARTAGAAAPALAGDGPTLCELTLQGSAPSLELFWSGCLGKRLPGKRRQGGERSRMTTTLCALQRWAVEEPPLGCLVRAPLKKRCGTPRNRAPNSPPETAPRC